MLGQEGMNCLFVIELLIQKRDENSSKQNTCTFCCAVESRCF